LGYPAEYKQNSAGTSNTKNPKFELLLSLIGGSFVYWVTKGYVVLDDAAFIIGEGTTRTK
jgi:hypothetical protein